MIVLEERNSNACRGTRDRIWQWWRRRSSPRRTVRRIAAEDTFVDERGAIGIRLQSALAIVRQYGAVTLARPRQRRTRVG